MDPLVKLPIVPLSEIFTSLEGGSLKSARLVSRSWNSFIQAYIWRVKMNFRRLENNLERNWREAEYIEEVPMYYDLPYRVSKIEDASSRFVAIRKVSSFHLRNTKIAIFGVEDGMFFEVRNPFGPVAKKAKTNEFDLALSNSIVALRVAVKSENNVKMQNVRVFCHDRRMRMVEENIEGLYHFEVSRNDYHPEVLVLFTDTTIMVWQFGQGGNVVKTHIDCNTRDDFVSSALLNGFVINSAYLTGGDRTEVTVWEITMEPLDIGVKAQIPDLDSFFHRNNQRIVNHVNQISYVGNLFVCGVQVYFSPNSTTAHLAIRIARESGEILKEFRLEESLANSLMSFYVYQERLIIGIENLKEILILDGDVKNLSKGTKIHFNRIKHIPGSSPLMIRKLVANSSYIVNFFGGFQMLRVNELNFWRKN